MCCRRWNRWSPKGQAGARRAATPRKALPKYTESQGRSARATDLTCVSPLSPGQNRPQHAKNPLPRRERAGGRKEGDASVFAGGRGSWGRADPATLQPRRACPRPDAGQWPSSDGCFTECKRIYSPPASLPKRQRGRSSRRRPAPLQNRAQHGQPMLPSAAGGMTAKRRRTTGPRRRTWAWRTGCCPHGPGCRHGRAAGCWSPSHAPRA